MPLVVVVVVVVSGIPGPASLGLVTMVDAFFFLGGRRYMNAVNFTG